MIIISKKKANLFRSEFDYEVDDYDRLKSNGQKKNKFKGYTNKSSLKKYEFDYEEDPYEPGK